MKSKYISLRFKVAIMFIITTMLIIIIYASFSYNEAKTILTQQINELNLNDLTKIGAELESIITSSRDISLLIIQNKVLSETLKQGNTQKSTEHSEIYSSLNSLITQNDFIRSIYVGNENISFSTSTAEDLITDEMINTAINLKGYYYLQVDKIYIPPNYEEDVFSFIRIMNDIDNIGQQLGLIKINIKQTTVEDILNMYPSNFEQNLFITDLYGNPLFTSKTNNFPIEQVSDSINLSSYIEPTQLNYTHSNEAYTLSVYPLSDGEHYLCSLVNNNKLFTSIYDYKASMITAGIVGIFFLIIVLLFFDLTVLKPLQELKHVFQEVENEHFGVVIKNKSNDEIGLVIHAFNKMSLRLKELLTEVYQKEIKKKEAELLAMQAQINPHFLYNTMDLIYWNSRIEKAYKTSELIQALSTHFRHTLNQGDYMTTVDKEIEHVSSYLTIQKERVDSLTFTVECPEELLTVPVVNLVMLTLIENCFAHAFKDFVGDANIGIFIYEEDDFIVYAVTDNGVGCDAEVVERLIEQPYQERGFALHNIKERIRLYFNTNHKIINIESDSKGTTVYVYQPIGDTRG